jgi:hypothetical protein
MRGTLTVPFCSQAVVATSSYVLERNGGDDGTRTRGLCRDRIPCARFTNKHQWAARRGRQYSCGFEGECRYPCSFDAIPTMPRNSSPIGPALWRNLWN